jgi:hypothetical protein
VDLSAVLQLATLSHTGPVSILSIGGTAAHKLGGLCDRPIPLIADLVSGFGPCIDCHAQQRSAAHLRELPPTQHM